MYLPPVDPGAKPGQIPASCRQTGQIRLRPANCASPSLAYLCTPNAIIVKTQNKDNPLPIGDV